MDDEAADGHTPPRVRLYRSRSGPIQDAVGRLLGEAGPVDVVAEAMARRLAAVADAAYRADDARLVIQATKRLDDVLVRVRRSGVTNADDSGRSVEDELAAMLAGGPTVGDAAVD